MSLCRSRFVKSAVSFFSALSLVFYVVAFPLSIPVRAVGEVSYVANTVMGILATLGVKSTATGQVLTDLSDELNKEFGSDAYSTFWAVAQAAGASWDGKSDYASVSVTSSQYKDMAGAAQNWVNSRMGKGGNSITINKAGTFVFETAKAYIDTTHRFPKFATADELRAFFGDALLYFGNGDYTTPTYTNMDNQPFSFSTVDCGVLGGRGGHRQPAPYLNGTINISFGCEQCSGSSLPFYSLASTCGYLFVHDMYYGDNGYKVVPFKWYPVGASSPYYITDGYVSSIPVNGNAIGVKSLDVVLDYPAGAIPVDVPIEKNPAYLNDAVALKWQALLDQLGDKIDSLEFKIPMTENGLKSVTAESVLPKDLTQSGSIDIPDVGEGELTIPAVGDLALPSTISSFFPFCIPYDVIRLIKIFAHDPVTPSFSIPFKIPDIVDYTIQFDFSMFDDVFAFGRLLWDAVFIAGLAAATKKFIKW